MAKTNKHDWVCLLSGGQDSTTCLYWAIKLLGKNGITLNFHYGQKHSLECERAFEISDGAGIPHVNLKLPILSDSALKADSDGSVGDAGYLGLPASVVPGRNILFAAQAAALAFKVGANHLVMGVCQTDYSGYPDCRLEFIQAMQHTLNIGMQYPILIHTPLMHLTKAETIKLGRACGLPDEVLARTVTCYNGQDPACGECPACDLRKKGFDELDESDPAPAR